MSKFIYSIKEIFDLSDPIEGCLKQNNVQGYYIGPYQRGFKWKSKSIDDHIPVLLMDLFEAFVKSQDSRGIQNYFLQYITVKRTKIDGIEVFEVIDGQQRLTSLTLMFNILEKYFEKPNLAKTDRYLVTYSRYGSNGNQTQKIFDHILKLFEKELIDEQAIPEQDFYYMLQASKCFKKFFEILKGEADKDGKYDDNKQKDFDLFYKFIEDNVKIILNKEDEFASAEEVFANMNANKVPLTNSYLIKGLLLTKASRNNPSGFSQKNFTEIMDQRAIMGRTWDEMNSWFSRPEISSFFFGTEINGMEEMLKLIEFDINTGLLDVINKFKLTLSESDSSLTNTYTLFNRYHEHILTTVDSVNCLNKVKHTYKRLKSWYFDTKIYNLLGFKQATILIESPNSIEKLTINIKSLLIMDSNENVVIELKKYLTEKLPSKTEIEKLKYPDKKVTKLLLALSVFPESEVKKADTSYRFNFYSFYKEDWSLEHIFPQNPKLVKYQVNQDKSWVLNKITDRIEKLNESFGEGIKGSNNTIDQLKKTKDSINKNEDISSDEIDFIFEEIEDVDDLGNMALLSGRINSALSNGFFNTKRKILLNKINSGSFVPKHTIDVFSKMLETELDTEDDQTKELDKSNEIWSEKDIKAHRNWIIKQVNLLIIESQV
jgi:hypothetical protein